MKVNLRFRPDRVVRQAAARHRRQNRKVVLYLRDQRVERFVELSLECIAHQALIKGFIKFDAYAIALLASARFETRSIDNLGA